MLVNNQSAQEELDAEIRALNSRRNALSFISQFPQETFLAICLLAASDSETLNEDEDEDSKPLDSTLPTPLTISHVCRFWQDTAFSCPALWTNIKIRDKTPHSLIEIMLENARNLPLSVRYDGGSYGTPSASTLKVLDILEESLSRTEFLHSIDLYGNVDQLEKCLSRTGGRASVLEVLKIQARSHETFPLPDHMLSGGTPQLRHLKLTSCYIPWDSPLLLQSPHLTHLKLTYEDDPETLEISPSELCRVLRAAPQLQILIIRALLRTVDELDGNLTHLANLRSLKIHGNLVGLSTFLQAVRMPISIPKIDLIIHDLGENEVDALFFALKSALGSPSKDELISPRQLRLYWHQCHKDAIESWREFPISNSRASSGLLHSPQGQAWKWFCVSTWDNAPMNLLPLFSERQIETAFWTLADLRYLEIETRVKPSVWALFARLPKLEEVVIKKDSNNSELLNTLWVENDLDPAKITRTSVGDCPNFPFPSLRALVFHNPIGYEHFPKLHEALYRRRRLGAKRLEHLEFKDTFYKQDIEDLSLLFSIVALHIGWGKEEDPRE